MLVLGTTLAIGLVAADAYMKARQPTTAAIAAAQSDDETYTGSILYMPDTGRVCRQVLFDNQSGLFTDNGYVDCERAAYRSPNEPKLWSVARVQVISTGFRQR